MIFLMNDSMILLLLHNADPGCHMCIRLTCDFPFGFLPTTSVGLFPDSLPASQTCKSFFPPFFAPPSVFPWHEKSQRVLYL